MTIEEHDAAGSANKNCQRQYVLDFTGYVRKLTNGRVRNQQDRCYIVRKHCNDAETQH